MKVKNNSAVIRFGLKESYAELTQNPKKESLIMLYFSSHGKRFKKSTGFKCSLKLWDRDKQRLKTGKGMLSAAYKINNILNELEKAILDEYYKMIENSNLNLKDLSERVGRKISGDSRFTDENDQSLFNFCNQVLESKKGNISKTTERSYQQTINILGGYSKKYDIELTFDDVDMRFYRQFCGYMELEKYALNSIGKHIKNLKTFLNEALTLNLTSNLIFKNKAFSVPKEEVNEIYLNEDEIEKLADCDLSKFPLRQQARDIFLIGYCTGQRVSDYNGLTENNLLEIQGKKLIQIRQKKTRKHGNIVQIPITERIQSVLNRYDGKFPSKMSEPVLRRELKKAAQKAGLKEPISVEKTIGGEFFTQTFPKYELVKTHTARRSFCTNHYLNGKPIQQIMLFSGHKTEREFLKYVRIKKQQEVLAVIDSGFFR
ncbi:site-specific integrase [Allomuricauda taeanensis]|uniref:tyrosine-type recombinase/integrase n=1 Tax=Flagellimonas taeanensis TaxID=1005926 RepID=UPI002E7BFD09|nr:site-specific integrase [Allomuricauda taeanensis]MEE1961194.1 site-specific integrase [Allomuricauda taeanensis]